MKRWLVLLLVVAITGSFVFAEGASEEAGAEDEVTIGMSVPVLANPFWRAFADMGESAAEALGATITVVDANETDSKQLDQIQGLISAGVDAIDRKSTRLNSSHYS